MTMYVNNEILKERFTGAVSINSVDERGSYIAEPGNGGGVHYLYEDGLIRVGVNASDECGAFWPTEQDAETFWKEWLAN